MAGTALAYVLSVDRERQLFHSLSSALTFGAGIDRFVVFCVGEPPAHWCFDDPRIEVREVAPLFGRYFHGNKVRICELDAERVLFLDTDTLVRGPLASLWQKSSHDFRGRPAQANHSPRWRPEVWNQSFRDFGV